jgi:hypothetical protein
MSSESVFIRELRVEGPQPEAEAAFEELVVFAFVETVEANGFLANGELPECGRGH